MPGHDTALYVLILTTLYIIKGLTIKIIGFETITTQGASLWVKNKITVYGPTINFLSTICDATRLSTL